LLRLVSARPSNRNPLQRPFPALFLGASAPHAIMPGGIGSIMLLLLLLLASAPTPRAAGPSLPWRRGVSEAWDQQLNWQENRLPCGDEVAELPLLSADYAITVSGNVRSPTHPSPPSDLFYLAPATNASRNSCIHASPCPGPARVARCGDTHPTPPSPLPLLHITSLRPPPTFPLRRPVIHARGNLCFRVCHHDDVIATSTYLCRPPSQQYAYGIELSADNVGILFDDASGVFFPEANRALATCSRITDLTVREIADGVIEATWDVDTPAASYVSAQRCGHVEQALTLDA